MLLILFEKHTLLSPPHSNDTYSISKPESFKIEKGTTNIFLSTKSSIPTERIFFLNMG
jgi:hypothetical protein